MRPASIGATASAVLTAACACAACYLDVRPPTAQFDHTSVHCGDLEVTVHKIEFVPPDEKNAISRRDPNGHWVMVVVDLTVQNDSDRPKVFRRMWQRLITDDAQYNPEILAPGDATHSEALAIFIEPSGRRDVKLAFEIPDGDRQSTTSQLGLQIQAQQLTPRCYIDITSADRIKGEG